MSATNRTHNLLCDGIASLREVLGLPPSVSDLEICQKFGPLLSGWLTAAATLAGKCGGCRNG